MTKKTTNQNTDLRQSIQAAKSSFPSHLNEVATQSALPRLLTILGNATAPAHAQLDSIENMLNQILDLRHPALPSDTAETSAEFQGEGIIPQLYFGIISAHQVTERLEKVEKHLRAIIG